MGEKSVPSWSIRSILDVCKFSLDEIDPAFKSLLLNAELLQVYSFLVNEMITPFTTHSDESFTNLITGIYSDPSVL
jgi:ribosome-associated toxin RatA of RatAB toxin-antitoxin module